MNPKKSMKMYPRIDYEFRKKHSFNFDMMKAQIFLDRPTPKGIKAMVWVGYFFIGFYTGLTAYLV
jgi:hypothetical protein